MIADSERRAIATRLRELPDDSTYPDLIGAIANHDGWYAAVDAADRLADLIETEPERTCRMNYAGEVPPSVRYSCYFCSECGSPIYNDMEPSYCPNCGARVVSE